MMRRLSVFCERPPSILLTKQHASMMLDKAPINTEPSPYKPAEINTQPLGLDVERSREVADSRSDAAVQIPNFSAKPSLEDIRRWQQSRIRSKTAVETAQHAVGFASRLRSPSSYLSEETDVIRTRRLKAEEEKAQRHIEETRFIESVRRERQGDNDIKRHGFATKSDMSSGVEEVINFPKKVMEMEEKAFNEKRKAELALALGSVSTQEKNRKVQVQAVGNLSVVNFSGATQDMKSTLPPTYVPHKPSRLLVKQKEASVPRSHPFVDLEEETDTKMVFRTASTGGSIIPSGTPPTSHTLVQLKLPSVISGDFHHSDAALSEEATVHLIQEDQDLLLASHRHYASEGSSPLRHPQAINLNRAPQAAESAKASSSEPEKPLLQQVIEGDVQLDKEDANTLQMTPLEKQRYFDVLETQRQADIANAFSKAKAFETDSRRKFNAAKYSNPKEAHLHNKFANADDASLKAQHAYLQKLLEKDAFGNTENAPTSNGVQWIGTTPQMFNKRVHAFLVRVVGSSVLLGAILYLNPSLLEAPPELPSVPTPKKKSEILMSPALSR